MNSIRRILQKLQYRDRDLSTASIDGKDFLEYRLYETPVIYFSTHYAPEGREVLRDILLAIWNQNKTKLYITLDIGVDADHPNVRFYNTKMKPGDVNHPIGVFDYGKNKEQYEKMLSNLEKEKVDAGALWDFVRDTLQTKREKTVDKDLVANLTALKGNIQGKTNERTAHILIDRAIFIKFMEDRGFIGPEFFSVVNCKEFIDVLAKESVKILDKIFQKANDLLNGDIFRNETLKDVGKEVISELHKFFITDYETGQLTIFPYKFDRISLPLISNIYESFLEEKKQEKGIYYTPESVVDLILTDTLEKQIRKKSNEHKEPEITVFDPACGSGIFLVKALKRLEEAYRNYFEKQGKKFTLGDRKRILEKNIYGVDSDENAVRIATFSLYLALFEGEKSEKIREIVKKGFDFPILGDNVLVQNSLKKDVFKDKKFDCIVGNPPWGYRFKRNERADRELLKYLKDRFPECSDIQSSQFFLRKVKDWSKKESRFAFVVNNSIFYNLQADTFRKQFLKNYNLTKYIELSKIKDIIFKSSTQPGVVLIFDNDVNDNNKIDYYVPGHNKLSKYLGIIVLGDKDRKIVKRRQLLEEDVLWRLLVSGDLEDYDLVKKLDTQKCDGYKITCSSGFQPMIGAKTRGEVKHRKMITPSMLHRYFVDVNKSENFNWNQELRRKGNEDMFNGDRLILRAEVGKEFARLTTAFANVPFIFKHNLLGIKVEGMNNFWILQGVLNSKLAAYYFYLVSPQWGKGTRNILRNRNIESFPIFEADNDNPKLQRLTELSKGMTRLKEEQSQSAISNLSLENRIEQFEQEMDELVFDIYSLNEPERQRIRDFYLMNTERKGDKVTPKDMEKYISRFIEIVGGLLKEDICLDAESYISGLLGASVCFKVDDQKKKVRIYEDNLKTILQLIINDKISKYDTTHILGQKKIKIYHKDTLYIIKSNEFRDWTLTEAIDDAKEEIASYFLR